MTFETYFTWLAVIGVTALVTLIIFMIGVLLYSLWRNGI